MKCFSTWTQQPSSAQRVLVPVLALSQLGVLSFLLVSSQIPSGDGGAGLHRGDVALGLLCSPGRLLCHAGASKGRSLFSILSTPAVGQGHPGEPFAGLLP